MITEMKIIIYIYRTFFYPRFCRYIYPRGFLEKHLLQVTIDLTNKSHFPNLSLFHGHFGNKAKRKQLHIGTNYWYPGFCQVFENFVSLIMCVMQLFLKEAMIVTEKLYLETECENSKSPDRKYRVCLKNRYNCDRAGL